MTPIRFGISAALGTKALIGGAVVALAAGAAAGTVTTHSANPAAWGQQVAEKVEACRAKDVNVGQCVSAFAQQHGDQMRAQHSEAAEKASASPSPKPGQREGQEAGQSSNGQGQGQGHATPSAAPTDRGDHGHGKPTPHP